MHAVLIDFMWNIRDLNLKKLFFVAKFICQKYNMVLFFINIWYICPHAIVFSIPSIIADPKNIT